MGAVALIMAGSGGGRTVPLLVCQRRRKTLPLGRSKSQPLGAAPWGVMPSSSKNVPRRPSRQHPSDAPAGQ